MACPTPVPKCRDEMLAAFISWKVIFLFGSPTSTLILSEMIRSHQPFYEERLTPFEDAHVCFDLLRSCNLGFVHQVLTYSRRQSDSMLSRIRSLSSGFWLFARLSFVVEHGRDYLSAKEYGRCLKKAERQYFTYLASYVWKFRSRTPEFWEFHRRLLKSINYEFDRKRVSRWLLRALIEKAWGTFWRRWDEDSRVEPCSE